MDHVPWLFGCRCIKGEPAIEEYYEMHSEAEKYNKEISEAVMQNSVAQHFLTLGRVVVVKSQSVSPYTWLISIPVKTCSMNLVFT